MSSTHPACGEVGTLPPDDAVWRLTKDSEDFLFWSDEQQRWLLRVPSNALKFDPDLSTLWREHMEHVHGAVAEQVCEDPPGRSVVYEAQIGALAALGLTPSHTPVSAEPPECAHASFDRQAGMAKEDRRALDWDIANLMVHVSGAITLVRPEGA